jgi:hypothetical protein
VGDSDVWPRPTLWENQSVHFGLGRRGEVQCAWWVFTRNGVAVVSWHSTLAFGCVASLALICYVNHYKDCVEHPALV